MKEIQNIDKIKLVLCLKKAQQQINILKEQNDLLIYKLLEANKECKVLNNLLYLKNNINIIAESIQI